MASDMNPTQEHCQDPGLCWFCGQELKDDNLAVTVEMEKKVAEAVGGGLHRTWWGHQTVEVRRCQTCKNEDDRKLKAETIFLAPVVVLLVALAAMGLVPWTDESAFDSAFSIFVSIGLPPVVLAALVAICYANKGRRKIARNPAGQHPAVRQLRSCGWNVRRFGKGTWR
jgi:hypothetical protein